MCKCFNCGHNTVVWQNDFSYEDYDLEGEGIVHVLYCTHCHSDITYYTPLDEEEEIYDD